MKATANNFLRFLRDPKQFTIPIYQRTYSWTLKQCQQLWNDIVRVAPNQRISGHFIGSIVYVENDLYHVSSIPQLLVIDGQQRLTTISLLLAALGKVLEERSVEGEISRSKINSYFLFNREETNELRYKLILTQSDKETLLRLLEDRELPDPAAVRIVENFKFFEQQIRQSSLPLETVYQGINKLVIVDISLDRGNDNPQLIFESLNSTGLDLSQADLIRNYILMALEPAAQSELYTRYWYPMEQSFGHAEYSVRFDQFMRDYLTLKTGRIANINEVYATFKTYVLSNEGMPIQEIVSDIYLFSKYFVKLAFQKEQDTEIQQVLTDINTLRVDVAYPFLLELYHDYERGLLTRGDFIAMLKLVESHVFRRVICGIPTNSLNKTFAMLTKDIDKEHYLESVQAAFLLKDSYRRFPLDDEFQRELVVKDVYNFRSRNYLLRKLENHNRKERISVDEYTIEHIMPQNENLSAEWQRELGEGWQDIQTRYLHTLGNLTLTGYNSELSDRPFQEKRTMEGGFADSPLRLNRGLAKLDHWNEDEIRRRAESLAQLATEIWTCPPLTPEVLQRYRRVPSGSSDNVEAMGDYGIHLQGHTRELFEHLRRRILNLDASVRQEYKRYYIAYKTTTNFLDIVPQRERIKLMLNMSYNEIIDPKEMTRDMSRVGKWGNGDVEVTYSSLDQLDDVMNLVQQAFERQWDGGEE